MLREDFTLLTSLLLPSSPPGITRLQSCGVVPGVFDDTVPGLHHTLLFTTLGTHWQSLETLAEITEGAVLLCSPTLVTLHNRVARPVHDTLVISSAGNLLLTDLHLLSLFPLASFLFRHG